MGMNRVKMKGFFDELLLDCILNLLKEEKCCKCDEKAKWIVDDENILYCDDHFRNYEEKWGKEKLSVISE